MQAWLVLAMGAITALLINEIWIVALGVIGYLLVVLFESAGRPAALETQNRQLTQDVQALQAELKKLQKKP